MDELRPPKEFEDLWLGAQAPRENIDMIVEQVLRDAGKSRERYRTADIVCITVMVLVIPVMVLLTTRMAAELGALIVAAIILAALLLLGSLVAYRRFYRSVPESPSPGRAAREHLAWSIEYLDRREQFFLASDRWMGPVMFAVAILFGAGAWGSEGETRFLNLWCFVVFLPTAFLSRWMTKYEVRRIEKIRIRLRGILDDQESDL